MRIFVPRTIGVWLLVQTVAAVLLWLNFRKVEMSAEQIRTRDSYVREMLSENTIDSDVVFKGWPLPAVMAYSGGFTSNRNWLPWESEPMFERTSRFAIAFDAAACLLILAVSIVVFNVGRRLDFRWLWRSLFP